MTTRPDLESDDYRRAREIMDTGKGKDVPMKDQIDQWKKKNKGRDPLTGMPLAKNKSKRVNRVNA